MPFDRGQCQIPYPSPGPKGWGFQLTGAQQSGVILHLWLRKIRSGKSRDYRDTIVFEMLRFQNVSRPHENRKPVFLFLQFEERFGKALLS